MGTLTSLLNIASEALLADQAALNATANNVANQLTPGYTREVVSFQSGDSVSLSGQAQSSGVTATVSSQRDRVLEQRVQQQTQTTSQSAALQTALQQVENIFGLTSASTGSGAVASSQLGTAINGFFSSLSSLEANPSDTATRQQVLTAATALAGAFNSASSQLSQISTSLNQQVSGDVSQINSLTSSIASLNSKIASTSPNGDAGSLEDQRQEDIDQLSQLVGLDQISTSQNGISLTTSGGAVLVSGDQSFQASTTQVAGNTDVLAGDPPQDVTSNLSGGDLGGALQARDQYLPTYSAALDNLAFSLGTAVNQQNKLGVDSSGNPGLAIFSLPGSATGSAATIAVSATSPGAVAAASAGEGSSGNGNATTLADLSTTNVVGSQTATGFLASFLDQVGSDASSVTTENATQQATLTQLTSQRNSLSSVSSDEEASNLTQYQRSYQAASQVFSIVNALMASAINLGEQTTVT
ncbi:flagellar hook-associated protein FlgK [Tunturibacter empetritectus]|uniref:flagellar hook-associated protein FlgK n=1 Tax=Tunturiibacter empetritectus TaxID=3069691 RepID=UPI001615EAF3|nr:flagellar hook-associated protein FlgK [Edaphobacter lichenicola]